MLCLHVCGEGLLNSGPQTKPKKKRNLAFELTSVGKELANSSQGHFHCSTQHLQGSSNHSQEQLRGKGEREGGRSNFIPWSRKFVLPSSDPTWRGGSGDIQPIAQTC